MSFRKLQQEYDVVRNEYQICRRKLDSKCEALLILSQDLDQCRQERDQFKLMAEQVQARYQGLKRQLAGVGPRQTSLDGVEFSDMKQQNLTHLLCEMREVNKSLQFEVDDLKQKLQDAWGDIKLLREQIARQRLGSTEEGMNPRHFPAHEREDLVKQLEAFKEESTQCERDLQQVLDEKEELVTERDVYKNKYERLNHELNYILKGDEKRIVDIDAMSMENKYLQERLKQLEEEKAMAMAMVSKYKNILEKKKNKGILKLGQTRSGGVVISQKQVHQLLDGKPCANPTPQMLGDLQALASALLESLNDKNLALSHQRKTNKILGNRVAELENKLKTLEVSGLWNVPQAERANSLQRLKKDMEEIQSLMPMVTSADDCDLDQDLKSPNRGILQDPDDLDKTSMGDVKIIDRKIRGLSLEDLDFLPTKDRSRTGYSGSVLAGSKVEAGWISEPSSIQNTPVLSPDPDYNWQVSVKLETSHSDPTITDSSSGVTVAIPDHEETVSSPSLDEREEEEVDPESGDDLSINGIPDCTESVERSCDSPELLNPKKSLDPENPEPVTSSRELESPSDPDICDKDSRAIEESPDL